MLESFKILKEIDGLTRLKLDKNTEITTQEARITKVELQIEQRKEEKNQDSLNLKETIKQLTLIENELNIHIDRLSKKEAQKSSVVTEQQIKSLEFEIQDLREKIKNEEESVFEKMEKKDELEESIKNAQIFILGASKSLEEITSEVSLFKEKNQKEINQLDDRIKNLMTLLPIDFQIKAQSLLEKNMRATILSTINNKHCNYCSMQINSFTITDIEDKHMLKTCPQCNRILIPSTSSY